MSARFYLIVLLGFATGFGACAPSESNAERNGIQTSKLRQSGFPPIKSSGGIYALPEEGQLFLRFIDHLDNGSKEGMRFAFAELAKLGTQPTAELVRRAEPLIGGQRHYGALHNYCKALGASGDVSRVDFLLGVVENSKVPVVRSAAVEALIELDQPQALPALLEFLETEIEAGPRDSIYGAIGSLGGPIAAEWLERNFLAWLNNEPGARMSGHLIFPALLAINDDQAIARLKRLPDSLAKPFQVKALARRAELGDTEVVAELRKFINPEFAPGPGVRSDAVKGLIILQAWPDVLQACNDPDGGVVSVCIQGLRGAHAQHENIGQDFLEDFAQNPNPQISLPALQVLIERGDSAQLDSIFLRARSFPTGPGSSEAINFLRQMNPVPAQAWDILQSCWKQCGDMDKVALLRVMGQIKSPQGISFLVNLINNPETGIEIKEMALVQMGNFEGQSKQALLDLQIESLNPNLHRSYASAVGRLARSSTSMSERLVDLALNKTYPSALRIQCLQMLPKVMGAPAFEVLRVAREQAVDVRERAFVNELMKEYF